MLTPSLAPPFPLAWGFSTRLDDPASLPVPDLRQVHGCAVVEAGGAVQDADGVWTRQPGRTIGVRVADCVPVLLAGLAGGRPWVAALHAGWRGAVGGILRQGVAAFRAQGGDPADLAWALGPAILACHFEVGDEVIAEARRDPAWREALAAPGPRGRAHLDLHGLLRAQALDLGLDPARDGSVARCTLCERDLLYSFRGGDATGRQWGWIRILGGGALPGPADGILGR
ncbi:polyphenol oxidase family protein [Mesoterricola sediminis]|uniref:Laccase domain protein n=1 Tax=Mesoterricola sediminis TaxID=2927980 RepID=A0AA48GPE8_9BACT|nr:polyphenol oxidase family protein [Mesoterricola sediminis]BDU76826.1 laccase domain protein [Mesoterricola sediminis]